MTPTDRDIADIFDAWRLICIARNYPDVPRSFDDLPRGTQATIRAAAELRAHERNQADPAPGPRCHRVTAPQFARAAG
jgi:hypothetical protein